MRRRLAAGATLGAMAQLSAVGLLLTSAWLIVRAAEQPPVMYLMVAIVSVRFFGLGRAVFRYGERLLTHGVALERMTDERIAAYRALDRVAPAGLPRQRRGDVIARIVGDVTVAQDRLLRLRLPWWYALVTSAAVLLLLVVAAPVAALVVACHVAACLACARWVVAPLGRRASAEAALARGTMSADASMISTSSRDIIAYGAGTTLGTDLRASIDRQAGAERHLAWVSGLGGALVLASTGVGTAAIGLQVTSTAPVLAGVLLLAPLALVESLLGVVDAERLRPAIETSEQRLAELASVLPCVTEPAAPVAVPVGAALVADGVTAGWGTSLFAPVGFEVGLGDVVGITGPSGIGKSTLAMCLTRLVAPTAGTLRLGGVPFDELAGADVRRHVGMSGQDDVLFDTTIFENLRVADPTISEDDAWGALDRAGLGRFVHGLPHGLGTPVGTSGHALSGGEHQRLGIARLLLSGCDLLVLDEPTEHLDQSTADRLLTDLVALRATHGMVLVSHDPRVLAACDLVVTLAAPGAAASTRPSTELSVARG